MPQYLCLVCNQCPAYGRPCLYCAGCKALWYCSADCQKLHWKYDNAIMPGWRAHRKECWFIAVQGILCEFLAHSLVLEILKWANRHGPIKKGLSKNENKDGGRKEVGASTGFWVSSEPGFNFGLCSSPQRGVLQRSMSLWRFAKKTKMSSNSLYTVKCTWSISTSFCGRTGKGQCEVRVMGRAHNLLIGIFLGKLWVQPFRSVLLSNAFVNLSNSVCNFPFFVRIFDLISMEIVSCRWLGDEARNSLKAWF